MKNTEMLIVSEGEAKLLTESVTNLESELHRLKYGIQDLTVKPDTGYCALSRPLDGGMITITLGSNKAYLGLSPRRITLPKELWMEVMSKVLEVIR